MKREAVKRNSLTTFGLSLAFVLLAGASASATREKL
jgi:hypothetical protein